MTAKNFNFTGIKSSELDELITICSDALTVPRKEHKVVRTWLKSAGISNLRAIRDGNKIVGGLLIINWGHFFGSRLVPAGGISFVGILPEYRRVGAASTLMAETLKELRKSGTPTSTLFAANVTLYQKAGYELAMERHVLKTELKNLRVRNMKYEMVAHKGSFKPIRDFYREHASKTNGNTDRDKTVWKGILNPWWGSQIFIYTVRDKGKMKGYIVYKYEKEEGPIQIRDYWIADRDAGERLLTFLADHSSVSREMKWTGSSLDLLARLIPDRAYKLDTEEECMLRICDVKGALEARGYMPGVEGELHLDVADDLIMQNNGKYVLKVKNGRGRIKKGGEGRIKIDIRTLAQMYTGFMSGYELKIAGLLDGPDDDLETAARIFAGPRPWIRDHF